MAMAAIADGNAYLDILSKDSDELALLANDLLINVTSFFRDLAAFDPLAEQVIPDLVGPDAPDQPRRVWVAGCSMVVISTAT
jgi:two-component system, chemotaxis family, CheB/CheR fusion protein